MHKKRAQCTKMQSDHSGVFSEGNRIHIPNATQQLDGILESISPSPGPSNWSSHTSNHNILGQLEEELVVKDTIKAEMESPHRESDQEGIDKLYTDIDVTYSDIEETDNIQSKDDKNDNNVKDTNRNINTPSNLTSSCVSQNYDALLNSEKTPFSCSLCSKSFAQKSYYARHMLVHTGEKPFSCPFCIKRFADSSTLKNHVMGHTGEEPLSCSECNKRFTRKSILKRHMMSHTGEKPFLCSICNKGFINKSKLATHAMIHTNEKPYSCSTCGDLFTVKAYLIHHMLIHSRDKPKKRVCVETSNKVILVDDLSAMVSSKKGVEELKRDCLRQNFDKLEEERDFLRELREHERKIVKVKLKIEEEILKRVENGCNCYCKPKKVSDGNKTNH